MQAPADIDPNNQNTAHEPQELDTDTDSSDPESTTAEPESTTAEPNTPESTTAESTTADPDPGDSAGESEPTSDSASEPTSDSDPESDAYTDPDADTDPEDETAFFGRDAAGRSAYYASLMASSRGLYARSLACPSCGEPWSIRGPCECTPPQPSASP